MLYSNSWPFNGFPEYASGTSGWCPPSGVPCNEGTSACYPSYGVPCYGDASAGYGVSALCPTYGIPSYGEATSHTIGGTVTASIAPQVFTEMPTLSSWHGTHGKCCHVQQNMIPTSCVQGGSTNLSEYGMPELYGFHNLNRQSVLLTDGTEHSYYVLPENYSLQQAISATSTAMPTVGVKGDCQTVSSHSKEKISEQQPHVIQESKSLQDMLTELQSKLASISENISQNLESMKQHTERVWDCSKQVVVSQPNPPTQEAANVWEDTPIYDVYHEDSASLNSVTDVFDCEHQQQDDVNIYIEKSEVDKLQHCSSTTPKDTIVDELAWSVVPYQSVPSAEESLMAALNMASKNRTAAQDTGLQINSDGSLPRSANTDLLARKHKQTILSRITACSNLVSL